jgi:glycosyltransferase involved in cell wall biosynthesis
MNGSTSSLANNRAFAVVIVSKGRPDILSDTIDSVLRQTLTPRQIIIVVPTAEDLPKKTWGDAVQTMVGPFGITVQRNKALEVIPATTDYVAFFDDDIELKSDYLEQAALFLEICPTAIALSGRLLADGGVSRQKAGELVANHVHRDSAWGLFHSKGDLHSLHGCNMVIRRSFLIYEKFNEDFPLYGFAEDYEMSMRLERYGKVGKFARCVAVHLAWGGGRMREIQYGYSLIANQWYCLQKGTVHALPFEARIWFWNIVVRKMFFLTLMNILKRDRSTDWRSRFKGILLALRDIAGNKCDPKRILNL